MKEDIKLPPLHYDELPEPDDPIPAMHNYARRAIEADRQQRGEPEYRISACYFPKAGEVELSWERQYDGAEAHLTFKATPDQGKSLVSVIDPCVYYTAALHPDTSTDYKHSSATVPDLLEELEGYIKADR